MDDKGIQGRDSTGAQPDGKPAPDQEEGSKSAVKQVASTALPLEVASVFLDEDGHIRHTREDRPLYFRFSACGIEFDAALASRTGPLRLRANHGKLPYSAESPDGRRLARSVMAATDRLRCGHILLSEEQDMVLEGEINPPQPRTPVAVIATAVALILDFKPYLDLLGEAVALRRPPPELPTETAGTVAEA